MDMTVSVTSLLGLLPGLQAYFPCTGDCHRLPREQSFVPCPDRGEQLFSDVEGLD